MSLKDESLVVDLTRGMWNNDVKDLTLARELADNHSTDAGRLRVVKKLIDDMPEYQKLKEAMTEVGRFHRANTMDWEYGRDLLPTKRWKVYTEGMYARKQKVMDADRAFVAKWQDLEADDFANERARANGTFNRADYPTSTYLSTRTRVDIEFGQVPDSDFRAMAGINAQAAKELAEATLEREREARRNAMQNTFDKLNHAVKRIQNVMGSDKPRLFDSLFQELRDVVEPLGDFAELQGDELAQVHKALAPELEELAANEVDSLRGKDAEAERKALAKKAEDLAARLGQFMPK